MLESGHDDVPARRDVTSHLDAELDTLIRENAGFLREFRVRRLGAWLESHGALAIRYTRPGFGRDRLSIALDDNTVLKLKLFWPLAATLSALVSIRWEDGIGWAVVGQSTRGARVTMYAWMADLVPARHLSS